LTPSVDTILGGDLLTRTRAKALVDLALINLAVVLGDHLVLPMIMERVERSGLYARQDRMTEEKLRARFHFGRMGSGEVA
jgi:hypothetical protein